MLDREAERFRCVIMRGGTSRAIFLMENELPRDPFLRDKIILAIFGSPDQRQIDGLAGAEPLTSKLAIIGPPSRPDADVDYTFGQVEISKPFIDYSGNCGNISSAVGPFAIEEGLVRTVEPVTKVRIYNTNTKRIYTAEVPIYNGRPKITGDYQIDGVPRAGAKITLDMAGTAGGKTGRLLPTGNVKDRITLKGLREVNVTIVDAANPVVFVKAQELGMKGNETPTQIDGDKDLLIKLEEIRSIGAEMIGLVSDRRDAGEKSPVIPMVAYVSSPMPYVNHLTGKEISEDSVDFLSRLMFMRITHKTYAGTATIATGAAAVIPGTVVNDVMPKKEGHIIRIGHPGGIIDIEVEGKMENNAFVLTKAAIGRTARRIMEGYVYVPKAFLI